MTIRTLPAPVAALLDATPTLCAAAQVHRNALRGSTVDLQEMTRRQLAAGFAADVVKAVPMEQMAEAYEPDPFRYRARCHDEYITYRMQAIVLGRAELAVLLGRAFEMGRAAR